MVIRRCGWLVVLLVLLVACQGNTATESGTSLAAATLPAVLTPVPTLGEGSSPTATVPPTWTSIATEPHPIQLFPAQSTWTPRPTSLAIPTNTRPPTSTPIPAPPTETPSATPPIGFPTPVLPPTSTSVPVSGPNILPNPSFENGWYNLNGLPELQVPNDWRLEYDVGDNPLDPDPWNDFVRPETRVIPRAFLPPGEHGTFIWNGDHTVKIFKGDGAISVRLLTEIHLDPGRYLLKIQIFPDLVVGYEPDGTKIWAPDPLSGEVQFLVDGAVSGWRLPVFGQRNTFSHLFTVSEGHTMTIGLWLRGRWAIENNAWFMDDWSLHRLAE